MAGQNKKRADSESAHIYPIAPEQEKASMSGLLHSRTFWFLVLLMVCAGASEQGMSQWASALRLPKAVGDLAGPCCFALFMGTARALYGKFSDRVPLKNVIIVISQATSRYSTVYGTMRVIE